MYILEVTHWILGHSLHRGLSSASDWALKRIPDSLRRKHSRWFNDTVAGGYIDASINIQLLLHTMQNSLALEYLS